MDKVVTKKYSNVTKEELIALLQKTDDKHVVVLEISTYRRLKKSYFDLTTKEKQ